MYNYVAVFLIILSNLFLTSICQLYVDDPCVPSDMYPDEYGICMNAKDCWHIREDLKNKRLPKICAFDGIDSIVCCRQEFILEGFARIGATNTSQESDCDPIPEGAASIKRTGQKAWDKCIDNLEYVYPCKNSTSEHMCERGDSCESTKRTREYSCGHIRAEIRSSVPMSPLYFGGFQDANDREFPHMALLGYGTQVETAKWSCSGTVVSENYVLTSGHCSTNRQYGPLSFIRVGLMKPSDPIEQSRLHTVDEVILHPDSRPNGTFSDNDIALIRTATPIILDERVYPACLHTVDEIKDNTMVATGWGLEGGISERLQKIWLEYNDPSMCNDYISDTRETNKNLLKPSQFCFSHRVQRGNPCEMDAGGPIQVFNDAVDCTYTVVGVRSFPRICGHSGKFALYTSVSHFISWIENIVWP